MENLFQCCVFFYRFQVMTKKVFVYMAMLLLSAVISGCATMTADECKYADWREIGLSDGLIGRPFAYFGQRVNDCAKTGAHVDTDIYMEGRRLGLQNYCRLENAAPLGLSGQNYSGVCPAALDIDFRYRYQTGYAVFVLRNKIIGLNFLSMLVHRRMSETDKEENKLLKVADDKLSKESDKDNDRRRIHKDFEDRHYRLSQELADLDGEMHRTREDLQRAELSLSNLH